MWVSSGWRVNAPLHAPPLTVQMALILRREALTTRALADGRDAPTAMPVSDRFESHGITRTLIVLPTHRRTWRRIHHGRHETPGNHHWRIERHRARARQTSRE